MNTTNITDSNRSPITRRSLTLRSHGRITKEDIRTAGLRRWNGRQRITTDWLNLYQDPELCFPAGDILVYLRQQGQSSRGPAFRVHSAVLQERGFHNVLDQCFARPIWHATTECLLLSCTGCNKHPPATELYLPAPANASLEAIVDYHITTRNFFAWLYNLPLAGRSLGLSLVALRERIGDYRNVKEEELTQIDVINFAESQGYLDFRECVDHALAALVLAENVKKEDLWTDAFAHAVGMSHRDMHTSIEYASLKPKTRNLLIETRLEMDVRLARASLSIETFFGDDLSGNSFGLSQAARTHFDCFRSFLHAFYIENYGFWPPAGFSAESSRYSIYKSMYADFRSLYHHLLDEDSSTDTSGISVDGGLCTIQNIQAFDSKHGFETLPKPLPRVPAELTLSSQRTSMSNRRKSWNPMSQKRIDRETKKTMKIQALIDASNRDINLMSCPLVRKYSEFEARSVMDDQEQVTWTDGRKVRWILIYAILQTLISIMAAPKLVRSTEGLSYSLCCHIPKKMPWESRKASQDQSKTELAPDINYLHANTSASNLSIRSIEKKFRSLSMPSRKSSSSNLPTLPRTDSFKRLLSVKKKKPPPASDLPPVPALPTKPFREIIVHGYGNGLNEVELRNKRSLTFPTGEQVKRRNSLVPSMDEDGIISVVQTLRLDQQYMPHNSPSEHDVPALSPSSSASVSRETSNASAASKTAKDSEELVTPIEKIPNSIDLIEVLRASSITQTDGHIYNEIDGLPGAIHINTQTWDAILG